MLNSGKVCSTAPDSLFVVTWRFLATKLQQTYLIHPPLPNAGVQLTAARSTSVRAIRKPFDTLAEGLIKKDSRGDWIRTSDLLNPIQEVAGPKTARASRFTAYKSYTSHILREKTHKIHGFQGVSCSFLHLFWKLVWTKGVAN